MYMIAVQAMLVLVYPTVSALYYDFLFAFLLPIIKLAMQHVVAWTSRDLEEYTPGNVVFCVGVFNALYMFKCMQRSDSRLAYGVIIALDVIHSLTAYHRLQKAMIRIHVLLQSSDRSSLLMGQSLVNAVGKKLSQEPGVLHERDFSSGIRIRSPIRPQLSKWKTLLLSELTVSQLQKPPKARIPPPGSFDPHPAWLREDRARTKAWTNNYITRRNSDPTG